MARVANDNYDDDFVDYRDDEGGGNRSFAEQLDLQHYLRILRKHKWPINAVHRGSHVAGGLLRLYGHTPVYSASSTLLIEQQNANVVSIEDLYGVETENADYYETQFELLKSRGLAKRVIERLDLWTNPELSPFARDNEAMKDSAQRDAIGETGRGRIDGRSHSRHGRSGRRRRGNPGSADRRRAAFRRAAEGRSRSGFGHGRERSAGAAAEPGRHAGCQHRASCRSTPMIRRTATAA